MRYMRMLRKFGLSVLIASLLSVTTAWAQGNAPWTSVGSAGTVDESSLFLANLGSPLAGAVTMGGPGTVTIRYNVVAVAGLLRAANDTPMTILTARLLDHGAGEQVVVSLKQYNLYDPGAVTTLLTLDSDIFPASNLFQTHVVTYCGSFDFENNGYFVEVQLHKAFNRFPGTIFPANYPRPALGVIKISQDSCLN